jgi:hypothetical protein
LSDIDIAVEQIEIAFRVLDDMERFLAELGLAEKRDAIPSREERIVVAQILENTYTAIETALLKDLTVFR